MEQKTRDKKLFNSEKSLLITDLDTAQALIEKCQSEVLFSVY